MADYFLQKFAASHNANVKKFTKAAMNKLMMHDWKGNVRELENVIERAVILSDSLLMDAPDIALVDQNHMEQTSAPGSIDSAQHVNRISGTLDFIEESAAKQWDLRAVERKYIEIILQQTGKKEKAAKILGIDRKTLYRKEKDLGLNSAQDGVLSEGGPRTLEM